MIKKASQLAWPPSVDELETKSREPPAELTAFLSNFLLMIVIILLEALKVV